MHSFVFLKLIIFLIAIFFNLYYYEGVCFVDFIRYCKEAIYENSILRRILWQTG